MTLDEAQQLAHLVEASADWIVTAIGRFALLDELQQACSGGFDYKLPWMVGIMEVGDVKSTTKLTCLQDWQDLNCAVRKPVPQPEKPGPSGMLF